MKYVLTPLVAIAVMVSTAKAQSINFFEAFDQLLSQYTANGQIYLNRLKENPEKLDNLYYGLADIDLSGKSLAYKKAFYINAYNLIVIKQEQVFYPIKTPFDIAGFFDNISHPIAGKEYTLDRLEKEVILPMFNDSRVHLVLVCGAKGCPPLAARSFKPETLNDQIERHVKAVINDNSFLQIDRGRKKVILSQIFEWYQEDFLKDADSLLGYLNRYLLNKVSTAFSLEFYEYDWSINNFEKKSSLEEYSASIED